MIQGLQAYHYSLRLQGPDCSKSSFFLFLAACRYKVLKPDKFAHFQQVALLICYARHIDPDPLASPPHCRKEHRQLARKHIFCAPFGKLLFFA